MAFVSKDVIEKAREMDLLTYLKIYEPDELVKCSNSTYCTKEHDSLKISNGKWCWFSKGIGGRSALDYLIKVQGFSFVEAVEKITGTKGFGERIAVEKPIVHSKKLLLPKANPNNNNAISYLKKRGIDEEIIRHCIANEMIYESETYHNVVFVGKDKYEKPRYANLRGISSNFKGEANGSDKRFSFCISADRSNTVNVFESAIDLLSYATMRKLTGREWDGENMISLAGVYKPSNALKESSYPLALKQFFEDHQNIEHVVLRLDNDIAGKEATVALKELLVKEYGVTVKYPKRGKDYNDWLCMELGFPSINKRLERDER